MRTIDGQLTAQALRIAIVAGRFNSFMTEQLVTGAIDTIIRHGGSKDAITLVRVPGSFEIPLTCRKLAQTGEYEAIVALGVIIRGATNHYDLVCNEVARGVADASRDTAIPIGFGVVSADNIEQAIERCGCKAGNKGADAAIAAIEMAQVFKQIERNK